MIGTDTALCPIHAVPALMPSCGLLTAVQPRVAPLNTDNAMLPALRTVQPNQWCAATTLVEVQSGRSMLLSGRPATQTTAVRAIAAKQVSSSWNDATTTHKLLCLLSVLHPQCTVC